MAKELYYYKKYKLLTTWDTNSSGAVDSKKIFGNQVTTESVSEGGTYVSGTGGYTEYEKKSDNINGFNDYELEASDFQDWPIGTDQSIYADAAQYIPEYELGEAIAEGYPTFKDGFTLYWHIDKIHYLSNEYTIYKHYSPGKLLAEEVLLDTSYPKDGPKDGYWWVRGQRYTIPAPTLISPDNAFQINKDDDMPYFVFKLNPRVDGDSNKYHARVRFGYRSDFLNYEEMLESKEDQTNWEYYNGSEWVAFPSNGVSANTKVRVKPTRDNYKFGFYYWDATAHNPQWNYGISSEHRLIIVITDSDEKYFLIIGGARHYALNLNLTEASNGSVGKINIGLSNHNL